MTERAVGGFPLAGWDHAPGQVARLGMDVRLLLRPPGPGRDGVWSYPIDGLVPTLDLAAIGVTEGDARVTRAALRDHGLIVRCRGRCFSTDELAITQIRRDGERWSLGLELTHHENQDGEPAPRDLYVLLVVDPGDRPLRAIALDVHERWRDVRAHEIPAPAPAPPPPAPVIEITDR